MANVTITGTVVRTAGNETTKNAAEAISPGQLCYTTTSDTYGVADNNASGKTSVAGMAINTAAAGQPVTVATNGATVSFGAVLTAGQDYVLSSTAGFMCLSSDLSTGQTLSLVGWAPTTSTLKLNISNTTIARG